MSISQPIHLIRMGRVPYRHALRLMQRMADARRREDMGDALLLVEHSLVITLGWKPPATLAKPPPGAGMSC